MNNLISQYKAGGYEKSVAANLINLFKTGTLPDTPKTKELAEVLNDIALNAG